MFGRFAVIGRTTFHKDGLDNVVARAGVTVKIVAGVGQALTLRPHVVVRIENR